MYNGHVTPITGGRRRLPGVNLMSPPCIVPPRIECLVSSPAHITRVNHDWLLKPGVTRAERGGFNRGDNRGDSVAASTVAITVRLGGEAGGAGTLRTERAAGNMWAAMTTRTSCRAGEGTATVRSLAVRFRRKRRVVFLGTRHAASGRGGRIILVHAKLQRAD